MNTAPVQNITTTNKTSNWLNVTFDSLYVMTYIFLDRFLLIGGKKGHLATMDWQNKKLGCEVHVQETVRDVRYRLYVSCKIVWFRCVIDTSLNSDVY